MSYLEFTVLLYLIISYSSPDENYKKHFKQSEDMREKARAELDDLNKQYS